MTADVISLPSAATSYITVRKKGRFYAVQLVTPLPRKSLRTDLYSLTDQAQAMDKGWQVSIMTAPDGQDWNDVLQGGVAA